VIRAFSLWVYLPNGDSFDQSQRLLLLPGRIRYGGGEFFSFFSRVLSGVHRLAVGGFRF